MSLDSYPDNPVLLRMWRGSRIESQHRGAWVLVDSAGLVVEGAGSYDEPFFARSATKCLQALPLLETGAAERYEYTSADLALALASHNGEGIHTQGVGAILDRLGLDTSHLLCGSQTPADPTARKELILAQREATALHNNCSGKHAGFLALAMHLGVAPEHYIDSGSEGQRLVREALLEMTDFPAEQLVTALDGCSAPTFRLSLTALATGFARVTNPDGLASARRAACLRMTSAVAQHPALIAGNHKRICTDLARVTGGRLFPKVGGEAIYAVGCAGSQRALALKIDDGNFRAIYPPLLALLERFGFLRPDESAALSAWGAGPLRNFAGLDVGHTEVVLEP